MLHAQSFFAEWYLQIALALFSFVVGLALLVQKAVKAATEAVFQEVKVYLYDLNVDANDHSAMVLTDLILKSPVDSHRLKQACDRSPDLDFGKLASSFTKRPVVGRLRRLENLNIANLFVTFILVLFGIVVGLYLKTYQGEILVITGLWISLVWILMLRWQP